MIERRVPHSTSVTDPENTGFEKKQYEILLAQYAKFDLRQCIYRYLFCSYDHELKIQKARENARRSEKEKEVERSESLLHDFMVC
jgi:hypothetical protein